MTSSPQCSCRLDAALNSIGTPRRTAPSEAAPSSNPPDNLILQRIGSAEAENVSQLVHSHAE